MKKTATWAAIALMMVVCSNCNGTDDGENEPVICPVESSIQLTRGEQVMVSKSNDFAFNLFREVADNSKSQVLSPISITYALGMLNNGAAGETQQQINSVLGFTDTDAVNNFCRKMLTMAPDLDPQTKLMIANTIYMNKDYQLKPAFVQKVHDYYNAELETRDFHDGKTMDVINQWASDHTEKMIEKILDNDTFDPDAVSYLLNAIYFKGEWSSRFEKEFTTDETFNGGGKVPMMHQTSNFLYGENDYYKVLQMPYGNGSYAMTVMLPYEGKTVGDILQQLTADSWQNLRLVNTMTDVRLPRFETQQDTELISIMSKLGMPKAFTRLAEFPDFCNIPVFISLMKQSARIKVNEEGAEAAAVTAIGITFTSIGPETPKYETFYATRPFLYIISELSTGAIFFIGNYAGE